MESIDGKIGLRKYQLDQETMEIIPLHNDDDDHWRNGGDKEPERQQTRRR